MSRDDPPTTITGLLVGEDPKPFKPRFVRAVLRCAFLAAPMLTLLFAIGAYQLDQHYRVITSFRVQTQFVESGGESRGGVLIVGTFDKQRTCEFVSLTGRASDGDVAGVTFMDRRRNEPTAGRAGPGSLRSDEPRCGDMGRQRVLPGASRWDQEAPTSHKGTIKMMVRLGLTRSSGDIQPQSR